MNGQMDKVGAREKTKENQGKKIGLPRWDITVSGIGN
jgi:hypothetical protein